MSFPELFGHYFQFCEIRKRSIVEGVIDLSDFSFFYPATLLPLSLFVRGNLGQLRYLKPRDIHVSKYLDVISNDKKRFYSELDSYLPVVQLPKDMDQFNPIFIKLCEMAEDVGGKNAFRYFLSELTDNIYQHSFFDNALVMAQKYVKKGQLHLSIIDDGIGIPESLRKGGLVFDSDLNSIIEAVQGASSKKDASRGKGLGTSLKMLTKGYNGSVCLISGNGGIHMSAHETKRLTLSDDFKYGGTLIAIKVPLKLKKEINVYGYVD